MSKTSDRSGDDDLLARIEALPRPVLDPAAGARLHARARAAFVEAGGPLARPLARIVVGASLGFWRRLWRRALEPIVVAGVIAGYLAWTATALGALRRGSADAARPAPARTLPFGAR